MNIILEDLSQLFYDIKKSIQKLFYNKFCFQCQKWLYKKDFIVNEKNICFCSQDCLDANKRIFKMMKILVEQLVDKILPESVLNSVGVYTDVKTLGWDNKNSDPMPKIIEDIYKLEK